MARIGIWLLCLAAALWMLLQVIISVGLMLAAVVLWVYVLLIMPLGPR